ncbi:MAG: peptidylprolyl isomerase [Planctomycetota bacterium]
MRKQSVTHSHRFRRYPLERISQWTAGVSTSRRVSRVLTASGLFALLFSVMCVRESSHAQQPVGARPLEPTTSSSPDLATSATEDPNTSSDPVEAARDDPEMIAEAIAAMPEDIAAEATAIEKRFRASTQELAELMIRLRNMHTKYANGVEKTPAVARAYRELNAEVAVAFDQHFTHSLDLYRYLPSPEAIQFMGTFVRRAMLDDIYDAETFEASARLLDVGQNLRFLFLTCARAGVCCGKFETSKKIFEALSEDELEKTDLRIMAAFDVIQRQYEEEAERIKEDETKALPRVILKTTRGEVEIELYAEEAPNAVAHFMKLVESGFYDGCDLSQVVSGLLILTGDVTGDGRGNSGEFLEDEKPHPNARHALRGTIVMAKVPLGEGQFLPNSASSQFAIHLLPIPSAAEQQTVIGRVVRGMRQLSRARRIDPTEESKNKVKVPPDAILTAEVVREGPELPAPRYVDLRQQIIQQIQP